MNGHAPLRTLVKDRLRTVRYLAREAGEALDRYTEGQVLVGPIRMIAHLSDKALRGVEGIASTEAGAARFSQMLDLLQTPSAASARIFAKTLYVGYRRLLDARGIHNRAVSEGALVEAYWDVSGGDASLSPSSRAAELNRALVGRRVIASPSLLTTQPEDGVQSANLYLASAVTLALVAAALQGDEGDESDVLEAASIAVDVMYADFAAAAQNVEQMAALLAALAPHLS